MLSAIVGTDQGALLYFSDIRNASSSKVEVELDGLSDGSPVVSLALASFPVHQRAVPAVVCVFASGHLLCVEVKSWTVLFASTGPGYGEAAAGAAGAAGKQPAHDRDTPPRRTTFQQAAEAHVLDAAFQELPQPDLISICRYRLTPEDPEGAEAAAGPPSPFPAAPAAPAAALPSRLSSLFSSKGKAAAAASDSLRPPPQQPSAPPAEHPEDNHSHGHGVAKYVVLVRGGRLFMYTLSNIAVRNPTSPLGGRSFSLPLQSVLWAGRVSDRSTVSSSLVRYSSVSSASSCSSNEAEAEAQSSFLALACLSGASEFILVAAQQEPALVLSLPLLDGYGLTLTGLDGRTGPALEGGVVLANGSCYMLQRGGR